MRKAIQINFIILVFAVFIVVFRQAFMQRHDKFYYEEGKTILAGNSNVQKYQENKHLFFYEAKGFHQSEVLFQFENAENTIKIDFYEVSYPDHSKTDIHRVVTYLMPIITASEEVFKNKDIMYGIYFAGIDDASLDFDADNPSEEGHVYWFEVIEFLNLNIYFADTGYGELIPVITKEEDDLLDITPIRIEIFTAEETTTGANKQTVIKRLLTTPFTITENSFPVRDSLINLFNEKLANEISLNITDADLLNLEEDGIYNTAFHDASKYNSVLYLWFGIYLGVVFIGCYFVFFFKKTNKLGRVKPPKGLVESIKDTETEKKNK